MERPDAHTTERNESGTDIAALRLIQCGGALVFLWVCWRAMASPFSDNSEFWPRFVLLSFLKQIFG